MQDEVEIGAQVIALPAAKIGMANGSFKALSCHAGLPETSVHSRIPGRSLWLGWIQIHQKIWISPIKPS